MGTEVDLAWAAGFFEGEGSTTKHGRRLVVQVKNTDLEPLNRLRRAVEAGVIYGPYMYRHRPHGRKQKKAFWIWIAHDREALGVIRSLAAWLSERRLIQAQDVLATVDTSVEFEADLVYAWLRTLLMARRESPLQ